MVGQFIGDYKQQEVAIARLVGLLDGEPAAVLTTPAPIYEHADPPSAPVPPRTAADGWKR